MTAVAATLVLGVSTPAFAVTTTTASVDARVNGSTVTSTTIVRPSSGVTFARAGVCVRNSSNNNVDFPLETNLWVSASGVTITKTKSFAPGVYRYWTCLKSAVDGSWSAASSTKTFTVGSYVASGMPGDNVPGFTQAFAEDFSNDLNLGGFPGPYASSWTSYSGFPDTSHKGWYDQKIISAHDGMLDLYLHTENGPALGAAPVPLVNGKWGGQVYGRFSVRMKSDSLDGFGTGFLLWSDSSNWNDGEIDFPESGLNDNVKGYNHCVGNAANNCLAFTAPYRYTDWHIYTIDWTPSRLTYLIDGAVVASTTNNIPSKPLHWVMQAATTGIAPASTTAGHLLIDWATIYRYTP